MQTYLFYDIETTGLSNSFDQVLQFAAIRTDLSLKEINRYELKVKLNCDVIPAPAALITHHIGIQECLEGLTEFDAIKQIHAWLNEAGTISLGYNTLGFDDEFLRFSFYRNLLAPYTHQYANRCSRMDIYPMVVMYYLYKNNVLTWPQRNGKLSLKLEDLNQANNFVSGRSHHAMVDVEATLALARVLFAERDMWDYLIGYFNKQIDQTRLQSLNAEGLMIDGKFGADNFYQWPVLSLGNHNHYKNQMLWLRLDSENLSTLTTDSIKEFSFIKRKKIGETRFVIPFRDRFLQHLKSERLSLVETNKKWLQQNQNLFNELIHYHTNFKYPEVENADINARLYLDGFLSNEDQNFCFRFHAASPQEKSTLTERLKNPKLKTLATRLLGRHYPEYLTNLQKEEFDQYLEQRKKVDAIDYKGTKRLSPTMALNEITELRSKNGLSLMQNQLLDELEKFIASFLQA